MNHKRLLKEIEMKNKLIQVLNELIKNNATRANQKI